MRRRRVTSNVETGARRNRRPIPDGKCTLASGWLPTGTLDTSAGGAGAEHVELHRDAPFVSGTRFDVVFRLFGNDGSQLRSVCVTVTVK